jgi:hypothetical protein
MKASERLLKRVRKIEQQESNGGYTRVTLSKGGVVAIKPKNILRFCCNALEELSLEESITREAVDCVEPDNKLFTLLSMVVGNAIAR